MGHKKFQRKKWIKIKIKIKNTPNSDINNMDCALGYGQWKHLNLKASLFFKLYGKDESFLAAFSFRNASKLKMFGANGRSCMYFFGIWLCIVPVYKKTDWGRTTNVRHRFISVKWQTVSQSVINQHRRCGWRWFWHIFTYYWYIIFQISQGCW